MEPREDFVTADTSQEDQPQTEGAVDTKDEAAKAQEALRQTEISARRELAERLLLKSSVK